MMTSGLTGVHPPVCVSGPCGWSRAQELYHSKVQMSSRLMSLYENHLLSNQFQFGQLRTRTRDATSKYMQTRRKSLCERERLAKAPVSLFRINSNPFVVLHLFNFKFLRWGIYTPWSQPPPQEGVGGLGFTHYHSLKCDVTWA
jgi:hypothetical protein